MGAACLHLLPLPVVFPPLPPPRPPALPSVMWVFWGKAVGRPPLATLHDPLPPPNARLGCSGCSWTEGTQGSRCRGAGQGCVTKRAQREPCCGWPLPPHTHLLRCGHTGAPIGHDGFLQGHGRPIGAKLLLPLPPTEVSGWTEGLGRGLPLELGGWRDEGWAWLSCTVYIGIYLM